MADLLVVEDNPDLAEPLITLLADLGHQVDAASDGAEGLQHLCGGKKLPEPDALAMCHRAINEGAAGVDMGRNIFQCDAPQAMIQAVRAVVHGDETPEKALDLYESLKSMEERSQYAK